MNISFYFFSCRSFFFFLVLTLTFRSVIYFELILGCDMWKRLGFFVVLVWFLFLLLKDIQWP